MIIRRHSSSPSTITPLLFTLFLLLLAPKPSHPNQIVTDLLSATTAILAIYTASCLRVVTTGDQCLVERFGRYHRTLHPGYHLLFPPFEKISYRATVREQVLDVPPQQCYTLDNAPLKADAVIYMRIVNLVDARYNVNDLEVAVMNLCLTQLREAVGSLTLDESFSSRDKINRALLSVMNRVCSSWGVEVTRVEIQNLEPSPDILQAMESQMAAERHKRATVLKSEGEKTKLINEAEGAARAEVLGAEARREAIVSLAEAERQRLTVESGGVRESILAVKEAMGSANDKGNVDKAVQLFMLSRYLEAMGKVAASPGSKVLMFPTKDSIPITYEGLQSLLN